MYQYVLDDEDALAGLDGESAPERDVEVQAAARVATATRSGSGAKIRMS